MHLIESFRSSSDHRRLEASRGRIMKDEAEFHSDRWLAELELASRAGHPQAAKAHLGLSTLHFRRMLDLCKDGTDTRERTEAR
jgi:hypothetical protein